MKKQFLLKFIKKKELDGHMQIDTVLLFLGQFLCIFKYIRYIPLFRTQLDGIMKSMKSGLNVLSTTIYTSIQHWDNNSVIMLNLGCELFSEKCK